MHPAYSCVHWNQHSLHRVMHQPPETSLRRHQAALKAISLPTNLKRRYLVKERGTFLYKIAFLCNPESGLMCKCRSVSSVSFTCMCTHGHPGMRGLSIVKEHAQIRRKVVNMRDIQWWSYLASQGNGDLSAHVSCLSRAVVPF